ncbi:MAG: hypothetical protein Q4C30_09460 [Bacteroidia bacterium]|nr:hypothetical protein [Bacteroidia bacterium]
MVRLHKDLQDDGLIVLGKDIYEANSTEQRVALLDDFFLKRLALFSEGDINMERLNEVFNNIAPTDGSIVFDAL